MPLVIACLIREIIVSSLVSQIQESKTLPRAGDGDCELGGVVVECLFQVFEGGDGEEDC